MFVLKFSAIQKELFNCERKETPTEMYNVHKLGSSWLRAGSYFHHLFVVAGGGFHSYYNSQSVKIVEENFSINFYFYFFVLSV